MAQVVFKFKDLATVLLLPSGSSVYTIGLVQDQGRLVRVPYKGTSIVQRDVVLTSTNASIKLTLWGRVAVKFFAPKKVIVVRGAWVKEHLGVRNISLPSSGSYEIEPVGVPGVEEMMTWWKKVEEAAREKVEAQLLLIISKHKVRPTIPLLPYCWLKTLRVRNHRTKSQMIFWLKKEHWKKCNCPTMVMFKILLLNFNHGPQMSNSESQLLNLSTTIQSNPMHCND